MPCSGEHGSGVEVVVHKLMLHVRIEHCAKIPLPVHRTVGDGTPFGSGVMVVQPDWEAESNASEYGSVQRPRSDRPG